MSRAPMLAGSGRDVDRFARELMAESDPARGDISLSSHISLIAQAHKPTLAPEALHGVVGEIVRAIEPHSEVDPAAILLQTLVGLGNVIGRTAHFRVEADRHYLNLFCVVVGDTAKSRKGTSWGHVKGVLSAVEPSWADGSIKGGLASGEGLIWAVRDPIRETQPIKKGRRVEDYQEVLVDDGVNDKRLLIVEPEFGRVLQVCERESNTLSAVVREAWDTGVLRTMTKSKATAATGAHISIIGHVTRDELLRLLSDTQSANGFGNRFLWACVSRSKLLPEGGQFHEENINPLVDKLRTAVEFARSAGRIERDGAARELWAQVYGSLSAGRHGLVGALTSRAEAQVMRLATLYAVLDCAPVVKTAHLTAALAVWRYCESSAEAIFGDAIGDPVADSILSALRSRGEMARNDIVNLLGRHKSKQRIDSVRDSLTRRGFITCEEVNTGGRRAEVWHAVTAR